MKLLYPAVSSHLVFKCRFGHLADVAAGRSRLMRDDVMPLAVEPQAVAQLHDRIRDAPAMTAELISVVIKAACRRFPSVGQSARTARIERLIASEAWTDAVLALIGLELPQWQVRRIAYDDGEWHCALSRERELPEWLDQSIEAHHMDLPLAILSAFVDAQFVSMPLTRTSVPVVERASNAFHEPRWGDHFA